MFLASVVAMLSTCTASAQDADDAWRTVETEQYRVHYPVEAEPWALDVAAQLDDIERRVSEQVGYSPPQPIDVVIVDPFTTANGSAWPL